VKLQLKDVYQSGDSLYVRLTKDKYAHINLRSGNYRLAGSGVWHREANTVTANRLYMQSFKTHRNWVLVNKKYVRLDKFLSERLKLKLAPEDSDSARQKIFISMLITNKRYTVFPDSRVTYVMCLKEEFPPSDSVRESYYKQLSELLFQKEFRLMPNKYYKLDYQWQDVEFYIEDKCHTR
jgi:hypothetical protein